MDVVVAHGVTCFARWDSDDSGIEAALEQGHPALIKDISMSLWPIYIVGKVVLTL